MKRRNISTLRLAIFWLLAAALHARADVSDILFKVDLSGPRDRPTLLVTNMSPNVEITRFEMTIGNQYVDWNGYVMSKVDPPGGTASIELPGVNNKSDLLRVNLTNFGPGESFSISIELDSDPYFSRDPNLINIEGWWKVFYNNVDTFYLPGYNWPNSVATVYSGPRSEMLIFPDNPPSLTFRGPSRRLKIVSRADVDSNELLKVVKANRDGAPLQNASGETTFSILEVDVAQGDKIEIIAPQVVYKNIHGTDITSSVQNNPSLIENEAEEKFSAIGISVNDVAQTGDPTLYRFEMSQDAEVEVKWDHEYALTITHDFTKTQSSEVVGGKPWVGPLASDASGNPQPPANKHWIKRGTPEIAAIDGQYVDTFSHPGLDIRYAVKGYRAYGPPNDQVDPQTNLARIGPTGQDIRILKSGTIANYETASGGAATKIRCGTLATPANHNLITGNTIVISGSEYGPYNGEFTITTTDATSFTIPVAFSSTFGNPLAKGLWKDTTYIKFVPFSSVEPRQQVRKNFSMSGPGGITWVWELQYGVRVAMDDVGRTGLGKIFEVLDPTDASKDIERTALDGVAWFDPGKRIKVVAAARENKVDGLALTGWANGDSYYFAASGEVDAATGELLNGSPQVLNGGAVANWLPVPVPPAKPTASTKLGFEIPYLQRPVRTLWRYGTGAIELNVTIGKHLFEDYPELAAVFVRDPEPIQNAVADASISIPGGNAQVGQLMVEWDAVGRRLYPTIPGTFTVPWKPGLDADGLIDIRVTATLPYDPDRQIHGHYPHIVESTPVALDPDPSDEFQFKSIKFSTTDASVDGSKLFTVQKSGFSVLLFSQIQRVGRGQPREFLKVRVVDSRNWQDADKQTATATIGTTIADAADLAKLGTGIVYNPNNKGRYNPYVYDAAKLEPGLAAKDIYDMNLLRADLSQLNVLNKARLPGPIIPVNSYPNGVQEEDKPIVFWYDDPRRNDTLLWPFKARVYTPVWPSEASLPRIVISSQFGNEGQSAQATDQVVAEASGDYPASTTYDPVRFESVQVYSQPDELSPGYNPNEEHALIAPSWRYREIVPRPPAVYALRSGDLNRTNESVSTGKLRYTSKPYVLVQFFDKASSEFKMKLYRIMRETAAGESPAYRFASVDSTPTLLEVKIQPHVKMKAGEPVIPFYPLGVAIGASPCKNTFGIDLLGQDTYWEDYKKSYWAAAGGDNAWFTVSFYYPLAPDFWWPSDLKAPLQVTKEDSVTKVFSGPSLEELKDFQSAGYGSSQWQVPQTGDCVAFLPKTVSDTGDTQLAVETNHLPKPILYKADWPDNPAVLKAGETLTFSGGENRADNQTTTIVRNGIAETVETPGLPQVLAFASAEIVFDSVNPNKGAAEWSSKWTARVVQALDKRTVSLPVGDFPAELQPASGRVRVKSGKYIFNDLPASLQRRLHYDPLATRAGTDVNGNVIQVQGVLEFIGLLNDKEIGDASLTAAPPAVYVLEPNILTYEEVTQIKAIVKDATAATKWAEKVDLLYATTRDPDEVRNPPAALQSFWNFFRTFFENYGISIGMAPWDLAAPYHVGLVKGVVTDSQGAVVKDNLGGVVYDETKPIRPLRAYGPGLAVVPNSDFLDPDNTALPTESWITVVENNDPKFGGSPITPHIIKVDRRKRYRGAIKTVLSDNVFDENIILRSTGDFGANADRLKFEWYYRPDDGSLNVPPPDLLKPGQTNPWKLFPDTTGKGGLGRYQITLKGNPNAPEALLADTFWFCRYRHVNDEPKAGGSNWAPNTTKPTGTKKYDWAGAGNSDPFHDFDLDGIKDYRPQLAMGWIKRVLDAVNPYEARIRNFEGDNPATVTSMIQQFGPRYEGPVALNPDKNVIENVGLIELYETVLGRGRNLSIDLSQPVSTPAISNALQLASTRLSDFYTLLGNEAYTDAVDPTIGFGSDSVDYGSLAPAVHAFQNQASSMIEEELDLLRGVDDYFARPVYNRLFWNFTKGEGEAAYATNYNISDINQDGFIDEDDAMKLFPMGHGDAWGHYLTALRNQYELLKNKNFNWVSRSEFYNLQDIVIKVDFLDERKFAATAAAKAKAGAEIVSLTYRDKYVSDPNAQWQGYTDTNKDRAWGVEEWSRRAGQGAYFDWVTANALLPSEHPNQTLEGVQKVDRSTNGDIAVVSANMSSIQGTIDQANKGYNPLGLARGAQVFDIDPTFLEVGSTAQIGTRAVQGLLHFDQIFERAIKMMDNAVTTWNNANESRNMLRQLGNSETEFRNATFQEDLDYRNRLISIFGKPYEGNIGPGKMYPAGYEGPDLALYMYVPVREITKDTVPGPAKSWAAFDGADGALSGGDLYNAFIGDTPAGSGSTLLGKSNALNDISADIRELFTVSFSHATNNLKYDSDTTSGLFAVNYTDVSNPKVAFENFTNQMPIKASGYTFQAPPEWGSRKATGELQALISQMIQQEAEIARAIGEWDSLSGEIVRILRLINSRITTSGRTQANTEIFTRFKYITLNIIKGIEAGIRIVKAIKDTVLEIGDATQDVVPQHLPTAGLAFSPGDALSAARGGIGFVKVGTFAGFTAAEEILALVKTVSEIILDVAENEVNLKNADEERNLQIREWLKDLEDKAGDEPIKRIGIFKEMQALRELSDRYRTLVDEGGRLLDERVAYNKRVAAQTQSKRYQDMTFRVARNFALQTYRESFDLSARYAYLAVSAYDYETNYSPTDPGSAQTALSDIVRARTLGHFVDGQPRAGAGGISGALAAIKSNYESQKGQLGFNNVQRETGEISLRTELFRILPKDSVQPVLPVGAAANEFPAPGQDSNAIWKQTLHNARVADLWDLPEYRYYCRPIQAERDAAGNHVKQPGIVIRFGSEITAGKNFFGRPLAGGDHAYNSSDFATKIVGTGVWLSDYQSDDVLNGLAAAPRLYLIPTGLDVMRVPNSDNPDETRTWNVVDQAIPVPIPATNARLQNSGYIPLLDSLNGRLGDQRKFPSFRAYHDGSDALGDLVNDNRLVGRSIWNTQWMLIIPGRTLNADPDEGLNRLVDQISDILLVFDSYGQSGG